MSRCSGIALCVLCVLVVGCGEEQPLFGLAEGGKAELGGADLTFPNDGTLFPNNSPEFGFYAANHHNQVGTKANPWGAIRKYLRNGDKISLDLNIATTSTTVKVTLAVYRRDEATGIWVSVPSDFNGDRTAQKPSRGWFGATRSTDPCKLEKIKFPVMQDGLYLFAAKVHDPQADLSFSLWCDSDKCGDCSNNQAICPEGYACGFFQDPCAVANGCSGVYAYHNPKPHLACHDPKDHHFWCSQGVCDPKNTCD